jgi:transglutaminase-like putative cysteine protease
MGLDPRGRSITKGIVIVGAIAAIAGVVYVLYRKRGGVLGRASIVAPPVNEGGMILTHYRHAKMPINERLRILQDLTWKSVNDPRNRKLALQMTHHCPERDGQCEAKAVYDAIKKNIRYTGDVAPLKMGADGPIEGVDLFQSAYRTWEFKGGDCDDHSGLAATMLTLNGIPAQFRVTAPNKKDDFSHIYVLAGLPKMRPTQWVPIDTTLPGNDKFGYEVPFGRKADYPA